MRNDKKRTKLLECRVATNLLGIINTVSSKYNKAKCRKMRYLSQTPKQKNSKQNLSKLN